MDSHNFNNTNSTWLTLVTTGTPSNVSKSLAISWDDATWILTSAFIIFTMQSGFGLLEAGSVSGKSEVNIMVKNAVDVVCGGITYWLFGFGISFGAEEGSNPFTGVGYFLLDPPEFEMGEVYTTFVFQLSFATTATTIVSGAMAERTRLTAYIIFSFLNTVIYCFPAHWVWGHNGFLHTLGYIDIAGSGVVHVVGGVAGLVATIILGPRLGRYDKGYEFPPMGNPANALIGMFMLWWGWLGFNCGSTFGISGGKWKLAAKSAATTLNASMGGGAMGLIISYVVKRGKYDVSYLVNSILGALVGITASCAVVRPWESFVIGAVGGAVTIAGMHGINRLGVDDPVGAMAVHGFGGTWGVLAVGLFVDVDPLQNFTSGRKGLFHGGGVYLLGVQALGVLTLSAWSALVSFILLFSIKKTIGLRMTPEEEMLGADYVEHGIGVGDSENCISSGRHALDTGRRSGTVRRRQSVPLCEVTPAVINVEDSDWNIQVARQEYIAHKRNGEIPQNDLSNSNREIANENI